MELLVRPSSGLRGRVAVPANKSHSFRALLLAGLAEGDSVIERPALSGDWHRGVRALQLFGATVEQAGEQWHVTGAGSRLAAPAEPIDCGNSGILFRFVTAIAALCDGATVVTGDESIRTIRPIAPLLEGLTQLGAEADCLERPGHAPVRIRGPIRGGVATIDGHDSQFVSALLIAASAGGAGADIRVTRAGEKPWVNLTLSWLARCGVAIQHDDFERYRVPAADRWGGFNVTIPGDWSAAMYPLSAGLLTAGSEVTVTGVDAADAQPDRLVLDVLAEMGASIDVGDGQVAARSGRLTGRTIDCNDFIDQFMLLAVVGALADGVTELVNAEICRHKECDRITEMARALSAMGASVEERPDGLIVRRSELRGARLDSRADHRMVMTLTVAALAASGESVITRAECVEKTFADFPAAMARLGASVRMR